MKKRVLQALQKRWEASLLALPSSEREHLVTSLPQAEDTIKKLQRKRQACKDASGKIIARISPKDG